MVSLLISLKTPRWLEELRAERRLLTLSKIQAVDSLHVERIEKECRLTDSEAYSVAAWRVGLHIKATGS